MHGCRLGEQSSIPYSAGVRIVAIPPSTSQVALREAYMTRSLPCIKSIGVFGGQMMLSN